MSQKRSKGETCPYNLLRFAYYLDIKLFLANIATVTELQRQSELNPVNVNLITRKSFTVDKI
jgi:hypothetical protein